MNEIEILGSLAERKELIPLMIESVRAGHPVEASDYFEMVDLNEYLNLNRTSIYFVRSRVNIKSAGIFDGDIMIVDKSLEPKNGGIVIAYHKINDISLRKVVYKDGYIFLMSANPQQPNIILEDIAEQIWGVVIYNVHSQIYNR